MANWIKVRTNLPTHPKVVTLASRLSVTKAHALGALVSLWCVADEHADENGQHAELPLVTPGDLDILVELPGFCDALASVGWMATGENCVILLNYAEQNGPQAKARALGARRAQAARDRNAGVTQPSRAERTRNETNTKTKRREENTSVSEGNAQGVSSDSCSGRSPQAVKARFQAYEAIRILWAPAGTAQYNSDVTSTDTLTAQVWRSDLDDEENQARLAQVLAWAKTATRRKNPMAWVTSRIHSLDGGA